MNFKNYKTNITLMIKLFPKTVGYLKYTFFDLTCHEFIIKFECYYI